MTQANTAVKQESAAYDEIVPTQSMSVVNGLLDALNGPLSAPSKRGGTSSDPTYSEAILRQTLSCLCGALSDATGADCGQIADCASRVEECLWLSDRCRGHVAGALRDAARDQSKLPLAAAIIDAVMHMLALRALQDMARDGFDSLADAISSLRQDDGAEEKA